MSPKSRFCQDIGSVLIYLRFQGNGVGSVGRFAMSTNHPFILLSWGGGSFQKSFSKSLHRSYSLANVTCSILSAFASIGEAMSAPATLQDLIDRAGDPVTMLKTVPHGAN